MSESPIRSVFNELLKFAQREYDETACVCRLNASCGTSVRCTKCEASKLIQMAAVALAIEPEQ